ncbi:hypothetical protein Tco_0697123, partial [Tanacetum coccineum]
SVPVVFKVLIQAENSLHCTLIVLMKYFPIDFSAYEDALVMRMASAAAKPYQKDSSEFYLITANHGASSSHGQQMNPEKQLKSKINSWFEESTWNEAEREISPDEVLGKEEEENLSFVERMAYKSYLSTKRQHRESQTKMGMMKKFVKK